jgi:hypothetical protein
LAPDKDRAGTQVPKTRSLAARARRAAVTVVVAAACLAVAGPMARQAPATDPTALRRAAPPTTADQLSRASAQARSTGQPVPVDELTTPTATTTATPRGTFVVTQTMQPTRVKRDNSWLSLDATLHRNADGTLSPNAASEDLTISGGGPGPLAVMTSGAARLALSWPTPLPSPTWQGTSATYPQVLPGVDLVVTATPEGGFSHVLVVKSRDAARNPDLARLTMGVHGDGVTVSTDAEGTLAASAGARTIPIFAAKPAIMWDSATDAPERGNALLAPDLPEASRVPEPNGRSHSQPVKTSVAQDTGTGFAPAGRRPGGSDAVITLTPDPALLTDPATVYPVYIDPTWNPLYAGGARQAWASVSSALSATEYDNSYDPNANVLQVGHVDGFTARSFVQFGVPASLKDATVYSSDVKVTVDDDGDEYCHGGSETDLWWTGGITKSIAWGNQPSWISKVDSVNADNCPNHSFDFDVTSFVRAHATTGVSNITFGLRAPNESSSTEWEEFYSAKGEVSMSTEYDHAPALGRVPATSPGGTCNTSNAASVVIGNDDVTFSVVANDPDGGQLGTEFVVANSGGTVVYDSGNPDTGAVVTTSGTTARLTLKRATIQGWHTDGTSKPYQYSWYVLTSDGKLHSPATGTGTSGSPCLFTYDPTAPIAPGLSGPTGTLAIGQQATMILAPCAGALADPPTACTGSAPSRYIYQVNEAAPLSVSATGAAQTVAIPLHHVGPNLVTAYELNAAGNPGPLASATFVVDGPATAYADGDIDGDGRPDFLTDSDAGKAGLWLASSDGHGAVGTPTNIGALGTGIASAGSPVDWNGAEVLHGDFTGDHVQDIVAYYPGGDSAGNAVLLFGNGDATTLSPYVGSQQRIPAPLLADTAINPLGDNPVQLVAGGNASLQNNPIPDLLGIAGDATNGYVLDLYSSPDGLFGDYSYVEAIAAPNQTPDGTGWNNYALATAQPGGHTALLALNTTTGVLYESTNPGQGADTLIGSPAATWTSLSVPWTPTTVPQLSAADINAAGQLEIWTQTTASGAAQATAYAVIGSALSKEASTSLFSPVHQWPLGDGNSATTAADTSGGTPASLSPAGATWATDDFLNRPVVNLDGTSGYLRLPDGLVSSTTTLGISLAFRAQPGTTGILLSTGHDVPSALNLAAMPLMYIGADERLYAQFWNGYVRPMTSTERVDDGQWHTATLTTSGTSESLFVDDDLRIGMAGSPSVRNKDPQVYVGAGVFPANTATVKWVNTPGDTTRTRDSYFTGQIANVFYYNQWLLPSQLRPYHLSVPVTGFISSELSSSLCIDDKSNGTTKGNPIQVYTCNGSAAQQWTIQPDNADDFNNTVAINGMCMSVSGGLTANSTPVVLSTCLPGDVSQQWHLDSLGQLWNPHANKCLADPASSTTPGIQLIIYTCDDGSEQNWHTP